MAVLSRNELREELDDGNIIEEGSIDPEDVESQVGSAHVVLTIDRDENKISNTIYSEDLDCNRDDLDIRKHRVPRSPVDEFEIPPREIAVLTTEERLDMPPDLVGRVGLRLSASQCGLIPLFGPQVDPGYNDTFYAVIYNASNRVFKLSDYDGEILKLEVRTLTSPVGDEYLESDRRDRVDGSLPQPLTIDTSTPNLSGVKARLDERLNAVETDISDNNSRVQEVAEGYRQIVLFGIFLLATATFGAVLQPILGATENMSVGLNLPFLALGLFTASWLLAAGVIIWHSLKTMGRRETQTGLRSEEPGRILDRLDDGGQDAGARDEGSTDR